VAGKQTRLKTARDKVKPVRQNGRPRVLYEKQLAPSLQKLVELHCQGKNRYECMIAVGYAEATARKSAWRVFGREDVQKAIEERMWKIRGRDNKMVDRIKDELANIAFFNIGTILNVTHKGELIYDFSAATMDEFAAIGEVTVEIYTEGQGDAAQEVKRVKVKPHAKMAALESLARIHGMFNDSITVNTGTDSIEARLTRGRERIGKKPVVTEGEFEEISDGDG